MTRAFLAALLALSAGCAGDDDGGAGDGDGAAVHDCDDPGRPAWVEWRDLVRDEDRDGVGAGETRRECLSVGEPPPEGWVVVGGPPDCAPLDPSAWAVTGFLGRDADGDGFPVAGSGEVCAGDSLPDGYLAGAPDGEPDCDDRDANIWRQVELFADVDRDGFGVGEAAPRCIGAFVPSGAADVDGDCAPDEAEAWALLDYAFRDADGDGASVAEDGQLCTGGWLPLGYSTTPGPLSPDCDDGDEARRLLWSVFPDGDGDGFGVPPEQSLCAGTSLPAGYSLFWSDCAADDPARWRLWSYAFRDADGDAYTIAQAGAVCAGGTRPPGYRTDAGAGPGCEDGDAAVFLALTGHVDADGDGHGAGEASTYCTGGTLPGGVVAAGGDCAPVDPTAHTALVSFVDGDGDGVGAGAPLTQCTDGTRPPGFVAEGSDCAPIDAAAWRLLAHGWVDRDGDDRTLAEAGQVCAGVTLPPPYRDEPSGNDCDDADPELLAWAVLYEDGDGDEVGAGPRSVLCVGISLPEGQSIHGDDADDQDPVIQTDGEDDDELELILS